MGNKYKNIYEGMQDEQLMMAALSKILIAVSRHPSFSDYGGQELYDELIKRGEEDR